MATVQASDGSSAVTSTSTKNDGGTVVKGGNPASDSPMTKNLNLNDLKTGSDYGSKVLANDGTGAATTDPHGVQKVKSGGTGGLAYFPDAQAGDRNFIIRAAGSEGAGKINNDASTLLTSPGAENANVGVRGVSPIHGVIATRLLGSASDVAYDVLAVPSTQRVPGRTKGTGAGNASTFVNPADGTAAVSTEIFPTRAVPGELTFMFGAANPTNVADSTDKDYKAKDSNE